MKRLNDYCNADFAVLYRTNAQSRLLEDTFRKRAIAYRVYGSQSFYQHKEIKDIIAYLRVIVNQKDEESIRRIINYPARGIGDITLDKLQKAANNYDVNLWNIIDYPEKYNISLNKGTIVKIADFKNLINNFIEKNLTTDVVETVEFVIKKSGIWDILLGDSTVEGMSRLENVQEFIKATKEFVSLQQQEGSENVALSDFLQAVSLMTDQDTDKDSEIDKVTLMTVHSAKGLEFKNVFIAGMENMLFPSALSMDSPRAIEEERRLFYVAITRAKENCIITYATNRYRNGQNTTSSISYFIKDIEEQYLSFDDEIELPLRNNYCETTQRPNYQHPLKTSKSVYNYISKYEKQNTSEEYEEKVSTLGGFSVGDKVVHASFGEGVIESLEGKGGDARAIVNFKNMESKKLLLKYAKLLKI